MVTLPLGYMRQPPVGGFVMPQAALDVVSAVRAHGGADCATAVMAEAELYRLPAPTEPLREEKAARLHACLATVAPAIATPALLDAGAASADGMMRTQLSTRAQALLNNAPWTVSAWLLGRWVAQHGWMFAGSSTLTAMPRMEFELLGNPFAKARPGGSDLGCLWQRAVFGRLYQVLVDDRLECREMKCAAAGDAACSFAFMLREGADA